MMLGPHILDWNDTRNLHKVLIIAQELNHDQYGPPYTAITGVNRLGRWHALQNLVSESDKRQKDFHDRLYSILRYTAVCDASDPRDKVYGLRMCSRASTFSR